MQVANIMLALGGDPGQVIPKFNVTPAEVAVLQIIHGNDAVSDVKIIGDVNRTHLAERTRLVQAYGRGIEGEIRCPAVDALFPGVAARLFETFDEMDSTFGYTEDTPEEETFTPAPVVEAPKKRGRKAAAPAETPSSLTE